MILFFIFGVSIIQFLLYWLSDFQKWKYGKLIVTLLVVFGTIIVFPRFFYPEENTGHIRCGLPVMAITFCFWVLGLIAALTTYLIYRFGGKLIT